MNELIFLAATLALLGGYVALTYIEAKSGARVLGRLRAKFDAETTRIDFIIEHVDLAAYAKEEGRAVLERIGHDAAHPSSLALPVLTGITAPTALPPCTSARFGAR